MESYRALTVHVSQQLFVRAKLSSPTPLALSPPPTPISICFQYIVGVVIDVVIAAADDAKNGTC